MVRTLAVEGHRAVRRRVFESQQPGVQGVARHHREAVLDELAAFGEGRALQDVVAAVALVVEERAVYYTHPRAHETRGILVCRLPLEKKLNNSPLYTSSSPLYYITTRIPASSSTTPFLLPTH